MTLKEEFATRNFSIYGQWTGVICIFLCFAVGVSNLFHVSLLILFGALCIASSFIIVFIEVPLLLRICPTSAKFDTFMRRFTTNYTRAGIYAVMSLVQWISVIPVLGGASSLIAAAVLLLIAAAFYLLAAIKGQGFVGSKTLGGQGVAQMII
ncbi:putative Golgi apparatus membrane protein tvp18 [Bisporella sp. PMI_857]|nr:putative Golgi apparatus membrane protein tvp18 [Bisporella sp. PMI_857]